MDIILNVFNRTMNCLEDVFNDIECKIDSGCCQTYKHVHLKDPTEVFTDQGENLDKNTELKINLKNDLKKISP